MSTRGHRKGKTVGTWEKSSGLELSMNFNSLISLMRLVKGDSSNQTPQARVAYNSNKNRTKSNRETGVLRQIHGLRKNVSLVSKSRRP